MQSHLYIVQGGVNWKPGYDFWLVAGCNADEAKAEARRINGWRRRDTKLRARRMNAGTTALWKARLDAYQCQSRRAA